MLGTLGQRRAAAIVTVALLSTACAGIGPTTLATGRPAYNEAIQRTSNEELLLNIVRLRYHDTPLFLRVSAVAANVTTQLELSGGAQFPSVGSASGSTGAVASVRDNPTVTYTPLQGDQFASQLLAPVAPATLLLLIESGWSVERILRLCVQRLNKVPNAPSASGPTPSRAPRFSNFGRVASLFRTLQQADAVAFSLSADEPGGIAMSFRGDAAASGEAAELTELLGLRRGAQTYIFTKRSVAPGGDRIQLETRSLMGSLFYLSQAVVAPPAHGEAGQVTVTRNADESPFDWRQLMDGLFEVHSAASREREPFVTTRYRGHDFYLDDRDLDAKSTFALLNQLFALQAGASTSSSPLLTLPISR